MSITPVELRHALHCRPEPSFEERYTTETLAVNIAGISGKLSIERPLSTGLLVEYRTGPGPYRLFRADIDALKISEETECPFASKNGFMHACGHDVHAATLYGLIGRIMTTGGKRNALFLFQPGEETGGGAKMFLESGALEGRDIESAFAMHVTDEFPEGAVASTPGVLFASAREVDVDIYGKSSHIAFPENGVNALDAMRRFIDSAELIPRSADVPFIFGIGKVSAGAVRNVIPAAARLEGSIRTLSTELSDDHFEKLRCALSELKEKMGIEFKISTGSFYPEVKVDASLYEKAMRAISPLFTAIDCGHRMTGEDFGFISRRYPSFMFWLGTCSGERHGLHNPKFLPADAMVGKGIDALFALYEMD